MASSIPKTYRKEITDALVAEGLKVALFVSGGWVYSDTNVGHDTYANIIAAGCTEVSAAGTNYTTGGYDLAGEASSYVGGTNVTILTANANAIPAASFTCRYAVIYEPTGGKIRAVIDLGGDKTVTSGTMTITWDATNGIIKCS
jgi:hypothetical protein